MSFFDDRVRDLKMDVCLNSTDWKTVTPDEARKALAKSMPGKTLGRVQMMEAKLEKVLESVGDDQRIDDEY